MLGYKKDRNIKLEEIETEHKDVLAVEGTIRNRKIRLILVYFDSTKKIRKRFWEKQKNPKDSGKADGCGTKDSNTVPRGYKWETD